MGQQPSTLQPPKPPKAASGNGTAASPTTPSESLLGPSTGPLAVTPEKMGTADVGIIGLAVMGPNLALNLLDRGFTVAVWNLETDACVKFVEENAPKYGAHKIVGAATYEGFAALLRRPRKTLILVMAGKPTDMVIDNLLRVCDAGDVIVDTGNAHFKEQTKRAELVESRGMRFLGMGVSGGAEGARKGPAFFPGGTRSVWEDIAPIVEAAAAKASDGRPCVTMCGVKGAGSCVKMYHNAGEYAVLQIWGEAVAALRSWGLSGESVRQVLALWKGKGALDSYMLDITMEVVAKEALDAEGGLLLDQVADVIGSKGTGLWSVQEALGVGEPVPSLAAAVVARQMSMARPARLAINKAIGAERLANRTSSGEAQTALVDDLYWAAYLAIVASYAQMFAAIRTVDKVFELEITPNLPRIISTFRAGCILQGALLEPMTQAFTADPNLPNLLCAFRKEVGLGLPAYRRTMARLMTAGQPLGVVGASLTYLETMATPSLVDAQVVALQRDVFGRHGFFLLKDQKVPRTTEWPAMIP